jgi:hypothetical protein
VRAFPQARGTGAQGRRKIPATRSVNANRCSTLEDGLRRRKPDPDRILCAELSGSAIRLARAGGPIEEAVAELRALAGGRGDLLAEEAGVMAGA